MFGLGGAFFSMNTVGVSSDCKDKQYFIGFWLCGIFSFCSLFLLHQPTLSMCSVSDWALMDSVSACLVILTMWIVSLCFLASHGDSVSWSTGTFSFVSLMLFMVGVLVVAFSSSFFSLFYICFELVLLPMLYLILGWGYQPERLQATMYMMLYTVGASLPLLSGLIYIYSSSGSLYFLLFPVIINSEVLGGWEMIFLLAFLVKLPMFGFHLWLPKAHVEAPVAGSMILAGVLLKLGGYGIIRVSPYLGITFSGLLYEIIMSVSLVGGVLTSFICLRQYDIKALVAYSSVGHMSLVLGGLLSNSSWGWQGALMMMIAHGLCSSGLFAFCGYSYKWAGSRSLILCKGMMSVAPIMSLWWFLLSVVNMAAPPSLNLVSEVMLISSIVFFSYWSIIPLFIMGFMAAVYSLYLFTSSQHGSCPLHLKSQDIDVLIPCLVGFLHWAPVNLLVLMIDDLWGGV
uniref:NADH-ubiquinone oxidoreductase chain 4 n=1 Tax=Myadora brevis TaxID=457650 RepID=A0A1U9XPH7_9BIVA|nr:NADH dehydrogenase subunit 4 [Myadora brevis]AQZ26159.1 NADH dehydrogenase subunit 4 [Myadora brevis]